MGHIHFIGVIHNDPNGEERLRRALELEMPAVLTVETSDRGIAYMFGEWLGDRENIIRGYRRKGLCSRSSGVLRKLFGGHNFEVRVPKEHAATHNIPLHCIDDPACVEATIQRNKRIPDKVKDATIEAMNSPNYTVEELARQVDDLYKLVQGAYGTNGASILGEEQQIMDRVREQVIPVRERDETPAKWLGRLSQEYEGRIVHVCGAGHGLRDALKQTVFSKIQDLKPSRRLLHTY